MKELKNFLESIGAVYEPGGVRLSLNDRRFAVPQGVAEHIHDRGRLIYAGKLLGRTKREFVPGVGLLRELGRMQGPHKAWIDERVGWLFVCGRDVFAESITKTEGELAEGVYFLVMMGDNCLGYGRVEKREGKSIIKNLFDLGDFLRREKDLEDDR